MSHVPAAQGQDALLAVVEARNQKLRQQAGSPRVNRSLSFAAECVHRPLPPTPEVKNNNGGSWFIIVDKPFPPCVRSIDELEPIFLSELVMEDHHRGKVLLVKLVQDTGCGRTAAFALFCDKNSDFELLKLPFVCMNIDVGHRWPKQGQVFAIKEPYLTIDERTNETCIRVDHPSDLLDETRLSQLPGSIFQVEQHDMPPLQCKETGNLALKNGDLSESLCFYNREIHCFLDLSASESSALIEVKRDLFRNRSYIRLKLCQYEGAITDALQSLSDHTTIKLKQLDAKAYLRASQASYVLKKYDFASRYCSITLNLQRDHEDGTQLLYKIQMRLSEMTIGAYDIASIQENVSRQQPRVDAADYLHNTVVKDSGPNRGRGLFATRNLNAGDLILAETAFASTWDDERTHVIAAKWNARLPKDIHIGLIGLWKVALQRVQNNPVSGRDLLDLHGDYNGFSNIISEVDGVQVVDTYQVHDIVARNAFQLGGPSERENHSSGVYIRSSYINHSCVLNSHRIFIGDLLLLHATKDIKVGEEFTISYGPDLQAFASRGEAIMSMWNFQCDCPLCVADARVPADVLERRDGLAKTADAFIKHSSPDEGTTNSMLLQAEQYVRDIAATYDNNLYSSLPRTALIDIQSWLVEATITCRNREKSMRAMPNVLRSLGYNVDLRNGSIEHILPTTNSILSDSAILALWEPLIGTTPRRKFSGDVHVAAQLTEVLTAWDRIIHGHDAESVEAFNDQSDMNIGFRTQMAAMRSGMARMSM